MFNKVKALVRNQNPKGKLQMSFLCMFISIKMREVFSQELMSAYSLDPCPRLQALSERCPSHRRYFINHEYNHSRSSHLQYLHCRSICGTRCLDSPLGRLLIQGISKAEIHRCHFTRLSQSPSRIIGSNTNCWRDLRGTPVDHESPHKET
ncbi:hypothetical protein GmHk_11G032695 [Glycine max]|nr:hypothetical protein GmHk_11G032695 [Glycine max]